MAMHLAIYRLGQGAMKQGRGTCSKFQSFLVILLNVPARTMFIELYSLFWYVQ